MLASFLNNYFTVNFHKEIKHYSQIKHFVLFVIVFLFSCYAVANTVERTLSWTNQSFTEATFDNSPLPFYVEVFDIADTSETPTLKVEQTSTLPYDNPFVTIPVSSDFSFTFTNGFANGQTKMRIKIIPLRKIGNTVERLERFTLTFSGQESSFSTPSHRQNVTKSTTTSSVLSGGKWLRLKVKQSGVYKLTQQQVQSLGFSDISQISVWSNGAIPLPLDNNIEHPDDLHQLPSQLSNNYIAFYCPTKLQITYQSDDDRFKVIPNPYSNSSYIYITDSKPVQRITDLPYDHTPVTVINSYNHIVHHENDDINLLKSGRHWYGERFDATPTRSFPFPLPPLADNATISFEAVVATRSTQSCQMSVSFNSTPVTSFTLTPILYVDQYGDLVMVDTLRHQSTLSSQNLLFSMTFQKQGNATNTYAYLDYLTLDVRCALTFQKGKWLVFRDNQHDLTLPQVRYEINNSVSNLQVWDITDIHQTKAMTLSHVNNKSYLSSEGSLKTFIAFTPEMLLSPENPEEIPNQNLHGLQNYSDYLIITHPDFLPQAERLATLHRTKSNLSVEIFTTSQIYNEYSSGIPDVSAIRNFIRQYHRRGITPQHVLLLGDGSYQNKEGERGYAKVPTYQSFNSTTVSDSYQSDDFFAFLDDDENFDTDGRITGFLDVNIGRLPVNDADEANIVIRKIEQYMNTAEGDWQNTAVFIADDEDGNIHVSQTETIANNYAQAVPSAEIKKIYFDAYPKIRNGNSYTYPQVNNEIQTAVNSGALLVSYTGHANNLWLAHESVLTIPEIEHWQNRNRYPLFITATCEFSRFDLFYERSAGEYALLNPNGGMVGLLSTTRVVYAGANFTLAQSFFNHFVARNTDGSVLTIGEIVKRAKNSVNTGVNQLCFALLADPALKLHQSTLQITMTAPDTLKGLDKVTLHGNISLPSDKDTMTITVFDAPQNKTTLGNIGETVNTPYTYKVWDKRLFKGKVTTQNNLFTSTFIIPKNIGETFRESKITAFGKIQQGFIDGHNITSKVGGLGNNTLTDTQGPEMLLYMNDERFVSGGITNNSPIFIAKLTDSSGINTFGGENQDILLEISNATTPHVLNRYYKAEVNSFTKGSIQYPLPTMPEGQYTATLSASDIAGNRSQATLQFVIAKEEKFTLSHVLNYPNPFTQKTAFFFEHNRPYQSMEVMIQVFTVSGKLVKTIRHYTMEGSASLRSTPIEWDGRDDFGDKIGRGVYLYKLTVKNSSDEVASHIEKLVILQ